MYLVKILKGKNSRKYTTIEKLAEIKDVKDYMKKKNLSYTGSPYFFTHVNLSDKSIVSQDINGICCSPEKLRDELKKI